MKKTLIAALLALSLSACQDFNPNPMHSFDYNTGVTTYQTFWGASCTMGRDKVEHCTHPAAEARAAAKAAQDLIDARAKMPHTYDFPVSDDLAWASSNELPAYQKDGGRWMAGPFASQADADKAKATVAEHDAQVKADQEEQARQEAESKKEQEAADTAADEARERAEKQAAARQAAMAARQAQENDPRYRAKYVADLDKKYGNIIRFDSTESMRAIGSFDIDCPMTDHRVLPLYNLILATAASDEKMAVGANTHMWYEVQSAGGETRVVRGLRGQDRGEVFLIINKWGELNSTHAEAIRNACVSGTYGPIWK